MTNFFFFKFCVDIVSDYIQMVDEFCSSFSLKFIIIIITITLLAVLLRGKNLHVHDKVIYNVITII
jgi:hypothetical protein